MRFGRIFLFALMAFCFCADSDVTFAAPVTDNDAAVGQIMGGLAAGDAGFGGTFQTQLGNLSHGLLSSVRFIVFILTAIAGCMVCFGIQDGKKTLWNWILGAGLALNFGDLILNLWSIESTTAPVKVADYKLLLKSADDPAVDILSPFMRYYIGIIMQGSAAIVPYAVNLTLLLAIIDGAFKVALDLISGDKVKYLVSMVLKVGFFIFLIHSWVGTNSNYQLMPALSSGFESMGYTAGGAADMIKDYNAANPDSNIDVQSNQIVTNALNFFNIFWEHAQQKNILTILVGLICVIAAVVILFLTALEMFMVRVEFWTMALITLVLLPFGVIGQLKFLADKAIGAMFNLAIKIFVIAFIATMSVNILTGLVDNAGEVSANADFIGNISYFLQVLLYALILFFITKKIPALVSGLLSGNPSLGGGDMKQMAMGAVKGAANAMAKGGGAVGAIAGGLKGLSAAAGNMSDKGAGGKVMSMMKHGALAAGRAVAYRNPVYQGYQNMASLLGNSKNGLLTKDPQTGKSKANANSGGETPADMWQNIAPQNKPTEGKNQAKAREDQPKPQAPTNTESATPTAKPTAQSMSKSQGVGTSASPGETPPSTATHTDNSHNEHNAPKQQTADYGDYDVPPPNDEDYYAPPEEYYPTDADYANIPPPMVEQSDSGRAANSATKQKSAPKNKVAKKNEKNAKSGNNTRKKKD